MGVGEESCATLNLQKGPSPARIFKEKRLSGGSKKKRAKKTPTVGSDMDLPRRTEKKGGGRAHQKKLPTDNGGKYVTGKAPSREHVNEPGERNEHCSF